MKTAIVMAVLLAGCATPIIPFTPQQVRKVELEARAELKTKFGIRLVDGDYSIELTSVENTFKLGSFGDWYGMYIDVVHKDEIACGNTTTFQDAVIIMPARFNKQALMHELVHATQWDIYKIRDNKHRAKIWQMLPE